MDDNKQQILQSIESKQSPQMAIIWLHGLGASGDDLMPLESELALTDALRIRHVFPNAPSIAVTINQSYVMPAWYDIRGTELTDREDESGIMASQALINAWIEQQIAAGIPAERIILAGFSQGGAMALHTALRYPQPLMGVVGLSCYLPLAVQCQSPDASLHNMPIFVGSGLYDPIVIPKWTQMSVAYLQRLGMANVVTKSYPMEHAICGQEIADIATWLRGLRTVSR